MTNEVLAEANNLQTDLITLRYQANLVRICIEDAEYASQNDGKYHSASTLKTLVLKWSKDGRHIESTNLPSFRAFAYLNAALIKIEEEIKQKQKRFDELK